MANAEHPDLTAARALVAKLDRRDFVLLLTDMLEPSASSPVYRAHDDDLCDLLHVLSDSPAVPAMLYLTDPERIDCSAPSDHLADYRYDLMREAAE